MDHFIKKHQARITGTISCFDRILFKGHLPLGWADAMERFLARQGLRLTGPAGAGESFTVYITYRLLLRRFATEPGAPRASARDTRGRSPLTIQ